MTEDLRKGEGARTDSRVQTELYSWRNLKQLLPLVTIITPANQKASQLLIPVSVTEVLLGWEGERGRASRTSLCSYLPPATLIRHKGRAEGIHRRGKPRSSGPTNRRWGTTDLGVHYGCDTGQPQTGFPITQNNRWSERGRHTLPYMHFILDHD